MAKPTHGASWAMRPVASLSGNPDNPRTITDDKFRKLVRSIQDFPQMLELRPIVVNAAGVVLGGNMRLKAVQAAGLAQVPVIVADGLTPAQEREFIVKDNVGFGEWDWDVLANEWDAPELEAWGLDVPTFGQAPAEGLTDADDVPEPPNEPVTKLGDLWILGKHRLLCGDSTSAGDFARLMNSQKGEMLFTDPPYGVNYEGGHFHSGDVNIKNKREKLKNDDTTAIYSNFLPLAIEIIDGPCYLWFADSKARDVYNAVHDNGCEVHALIIWHKTNASYAAMNAQYKQRHEPCLYFKPKGSTLRWCGNTTEATVWNQDRDGINDFHPTQKPVALAAKAIKNHEAQSVVDLFCGSGSTIIAAEQLKRRCYGMEIDPKYCDVIVKRWEDFTGQKATRQAT